MISQISLDVHCLPSTRLVDQRCIEAKKVGLEFGPQQCYSSQKYSSPGLPNSTMRSSNSRHTSFDFMIRMELFGSELKANVLLGFSSFEFQAHFYTRLTLLSSANKQIRKEVRLYFGTKSFVSKANHGI